MNDPRRLELERYFDGELSEADRLRVARSLTDDSEADVHLDRLRLLRELARRHAVPVSQSKPIRHSRPVRLAAIAAACAAGILLVMARQAARSGRDVSPSPSNATIETVRTAPLRAGPAEGQWYAWANDPASRPESAAERLLRRTPRSRRRAVSEEMLALRLANDPRNVTELERAALARAHFGRRRRTSG